MRRLSLLIMFVCLSSCEYFDKKKVYTEDIVKEELETFNWNEVDEYPTFESCKNRVTKEGRQDCFQKRIVKEIIDYLSDQILVVTEDVNDTITMNIAVSETGILSVIEISKSEHVTTQIPEIDSLLIGSLQELPKIHPAIKRGQEVKTQFKLPIVVSVN